MYKLQDCVVLKVRTLHCFLSAAKRETTFRDFKFASLDNKPFHKDGWMDDLQFYILFNSISVISGQCLDDNERLCAMELGLWLRRFHLE